MTSRSGRTGASDVFPYPTETLDLPNGLRLVGVRFDSPGLAAYYTVVRVGSRQEVEPGRSGFAHFFEHMMFRGTERFPEEKYNDVLRAMGADSNAYTGFDRTVYHILASSRSLPRIVEIEADRFQNLSYSEEQFRKEAGAVLGEYNKSAADPFTGLFEKLHETAYDVHPYRHTVIGFLDDIRAMPGMYDYSREFFDRFYRPEYVTLLVVGDFDWDELARRVEEGYGGWARGSFVAEVPQEPPPTAPREVSVPWPAPTLPLLAIAYRAPRFTTDSSDMPALDVLASLHFGETSPIYKRLVIEDASVDFIHAGATDQVDPALFTVLTRVREPEKLGAVQEALLGEVERLSREPAERIQLEATKSHMKYDFLLRMDTAEAVAETLAHYLSLSSDPQTVNHVYRRYDGVRPADLREVARRYLRPEGRTIVTLTQSGSPTAGVAQ